MFCMNCGSQIPDRSEFCPYCGKKAINGDVAAPGHNSAPKPKKKSAVKMLLLLFTIVSFACTAAFGVLYFIGNSDKGNSAEGNPAEGNPAEGNPAAGEQRDNRIDMLSVISNNLQNGGCVAESSEYIFFFGEDGIHRIAKENGEEYIYGTTVPVPSSSWLYWYGDRLFWYNGMSFYYSDFNFEKAICISSPPVPNRIFSEADGPVYYSYLSNYPTLYMRMQMEENDEGTEIASIPVSSIYRYDSHIYIISQRTIVNNHENALAGLWRVELDGSDPVKLMDEVPEKYLIYGDHAYYVIKNEVFICNPDGSDAKPIPGINVGNSINIYEDHLYYINRQDHCLYRINTNGEDNTIIAEGDCNNIQIIDGWIYYSKMSGTFSKSLYRVKPDGTDNQVVLYEWSDM